MEQPVFIAEASSNHGRDLDRARAFVDAAADAGCDAVKFQLYTARDMALPGALLTSGPWAGRTLHDLYTEATTPRGWFPELFALARRLRLIPFTSVFNPDDVSFLEDLGCPCYKIASAEIGWIALLEAVAETRKPIIISTGMATTVEINRALKVTRPAPVILLHCVSAYPTPVRCANLWRMNTLRRPDVAAVGVSDHSVGSELVPIAATAQGAAVIEKHLMLPGTAPLDAGHSLTPDAFRRMAGAVRETWRACQASGDVEGPSRQFKRRPINGRWLRG